MNQLLDCSWDWFLLPRVGGIPKPGFWSNSWIVLKIGFCSQELEEDPTENFWTNSWVVPEIGVFYQELEVSPNTITNQLLDSF